MTGGARAVSSKGISQFPWVALLGAGLLLGVSACEPPGKPKPEPPASSDIADFKFLFHENCSGCHGADGKNGPARILNDPLYIAVIPRDTLQSVIENGRPGTTMPAWAVSKGGPLTPKQVTAIVDGIEGWGKPDQFQNAALPPYDDAGQQGDAGRGKKLYMRSCFMCHGPGAKVGPVTDTAFLELSSNQFLRTSIIVGRPDLGMPDYRNLNMGHALANQDISDVASYLASLRPTPITQGQHLLENGSGQSGNLTKGNEGSGNGPGSPQHPDADGSKTKGNSSQGGGPR